MSATTAEVSQLNIDLAYHQARVKRCIDNQRQHWMFAFGLFDAPSELTEKNSFETYWELESEIQTSLSKIQKIKEKLR
ncbi:hypothetical protein [Herbiconiux daphne]|uniref:Uncharacterized protein n=1 Tax=Herbiconiux daphne TaxID=2970914 RepID=A0ABT2HA08_9MICO|nr:hypothetical protein [Herbiconiux daphne]MCS5736791.1 hypothetical protein [Herbiconiux daphne]